MRIMDISVNLGGGLSIYINLYFIIVITIILLLFRWLLTRKSLSIYSCEISEVTLGIGNSSATLHFSALDKQIAYQIWTEIATRKIGLPFDKENDVIVEVYDSWYTFFKVTRDLIKNIPVNCIHNAKDEKSLVNIVTKVLNIVLRPHLTVWQAKFRKWYENESLSSKDKPPQEIQKMFPQYKELVDDILKVNSQMRYYQDTLYQIAFGRSKT